MGQTRTSSLGAARPLPPSADIGPGGQSVGQAAQFCLASSIQNRSMGNYFTTCSDGRLSFSTVTMVSAIWTVLEMTSVP